MDGSPINSFRDLIVWQKAMDLVDTIYDLTETFPKNELYGLTSQMKRSAVSIPSNIAEGRDRGSRRDYRQFLIISCSSGAELETQLEITRRRHFGNNDLRTKAEKLLTEIRKMLHKMISTLS